MLDNYFTTGEFAKICGTTKETLFHYDEIGILKPAYIAENKYRYYSPKQYIDFDLIATLKETGSSLKQIKEYIETYTPEDFLKILDINIEKLGMEQKKLIRKERILEDIKLSVQYAMEHPCGVPKLEVSEEEYLIVVQLGKNLPVNEVDEIYKLSDHFEYCYSNNLGDSFLIGSIVLKETLLAGKSYDSYYYSKIAMPIKSDRLFIKPRGTYLTMLHKGSFQTIGNSYKQMFTYMEEKGLNLVGNAYISELLGYFATTNVDQFIMQISMEVSEKDSTSLGPLF